MATGPIIRRCILHILAMLNKVKGQKQQKKDRIQMSRLLVVGETLRANNETLNNSAVVIKPLQTWRLCGMIPLAVTKAVKSVQ